MLRLQQKLFSVILVSCLHCLCPTSQVLFLKTGKRIIDGAKKMCVQEFLLLICLALVYIFHLFIYSPFQTWLKGHSNAWGEGGACRSETARPTCLGLSMQCSFMNIYAGHECNGIRERQICTQCRCPWKSFAIQTRAREKERICAKKMKF